MKFIKIKDKQKKNSSKKNLLLFKFIILMYYYIQKSFINDYSPDFLRVDFTASGSISFKLSLISAVD